MSDKIAVQQQIVKVEEEIASAFAVRVPSLTRRFELEATLERLHRKMALP
jgi:hypothetical protein